jgi:hypothetical protein
MIAPDCGTERLRWRDPERTAPSDPIHQNEKEEDMAKIEREDIMEIAEGLRMIEEGVAKIQGVMRERKMKSIQDIATQLIPIFQKEDDSLTDNVINRLG